MEVEKEMALSSFFLPFIHSCTHSTNLNPHCLLTEGQALRWRVLGTEHAVVNMRVEPPPCLHGAYILVGAGRQQGSKQVTSTGEVGGEQNGTG